MAKKDFDEYFLQQQKAYYNAVKAIEDYGQMAANNMISTEQMKQAESVLSPIIEAYKMLSFIKGILDKPARNQKAKKYIKQNKKTLNSKYNNENIEKQNIEILNQFREEYIHDERNTNS